MTVRRRAFGHLAGLLPGRHDYAGLSRSWRGDVVAGVTVGVVALPLALAFGITSGMGAEAGLITAIVAGLIAAVFGGSNVQVSGPTGAMTVVLVPVVSRFGTDAVLIVGIMAGLLVVLAAFLRLGRWLAFVPWPVIEGFTAGIATIIFLQQVPGALGVVTPEGENTVAVALRALRAYLSDITSTSVVLVVLVAVLMIALPRLHRNIPASLIAVVAATVVAAAGDLDVARIGELPASLPMPAIPAAEIDQIRQLFGAAVAVAILAALESLLSAKVADGMVAGRPHRPDRELFGQGLANVIAPMFGGIPATGAIARTAVNVRSGARTRLAAVVHSGVLILVVFFAGGLVGRIPLAALAGVLMVTACRMVQLANVYSVVRSTRSDALVFSLTALATVAFDLILAVQVGVAAAAVLSLRHLARTSRASRVPDSELDAAGLSVCDGVAVYRLDGALFFGAAQRLAGELTAVEARVVVLRLSAVQIVDATGAQALGDAISELERRGTTVLLKVARAEHLRTFAASGALARLAHQAHVFDDLDEALSHGRRHAVEVSGDER